MTPDRPTDSQTTQRMRGALLGLAWGDVLGCPVEGWRSGQIAQIWGEYDALPDAYPLQKIAAWERKKLKRLRPLGLHSDDTQQALGALWAATQTDPVWAWGEALVQGMRCGAWRGYGRNFQTAVHRLQRGASPQRAGSASAGMGAAMRAGPLAALYPNNPEGLAEVVFTVSLTTHADIRAASLAAAVAEISRRFITGEDAATIRSALPSWLREVEAAWIAQRDWSLERAPGHLISETLQRAFTTPHEPGEPLRALVSKLAKPHLARGFTRAHPNQGFALLGGLHAVLVSVHDETRDPHEALCAIIRQGFDTDTVAAIAGAMLGARFGTAWVPVHRLRDAARLERWADAIAQGQSEEGLDALLRAEASWTEQESQAQTRYAAAGA